MKKTGSTGNLFFNDQNHSMRSTLRPITSHKFRKNSNFIMENDSYNNNNYNLEHLLLNKTSKQLYDGLMSLKKRVNYLNEEISLAKSAQRKKDVQLSLKNKEIEEYMSDIKMSKDLNPINVDKLKEINIITKLKKEYNTLKANLDDIKNKKSILEIKLKKSRPNKVKQTNLALEKRLKILIMEYNILHQNNTAMNKQLEEMKNYPKIFAENHKIIENLKNRIDDQEQTVLNLKEQINEVNNKKNLNEILLDRQKIKNINLNQKNQYLENEIQNRKKITEMKTNYDNKLQRLNEKKTELEDKLRNQERAINAIKQEIRISEEKKRVDPHKLKIFNYTSIAKLESNPQDKVDSKLILLQSLLDESINKKKKYQESIQNCVERFKELGYDYSELDKLLEENKDNLEEDNEENKENDEPNEQKENKNINNDKKDDKKMNMNNNEEINMEINNENQNINDNDDNKEKKEEIDAKINNDSKEDILNKNINVEEANEENNKSQNNEEQNLFNKDTNEINNNTNNNKDNNKDIINDIDKEINDNNIIKEESKQEKETAKNDLQIPDIKNKNKNNEIINNNSINNNTKFSNISIKDKPEKKLPITNDEFSEFTFILVKNLEAKKINEELARQKIIIVPTREQMEKQTFIDQMSFNIMKAIHCENKDSLEKVKTWLNSFLTMCDDDEKKMTESFLSLFKEVNIYNSEKELMFSKKIKKYLCKKNPDFPKKLELYRNKYITFQFLKKLIEEQNIELKDEYSQYLFYELKKFEDPQATIQELKVENLFKIFENSQNDSKMEEESEIEITNEQYVNIIYNIGLQLIKYLDTNKTTLRQILGESIKNISGENVAEKDKVEVIVLEDFIEKLKEIGIQINSEIEIYCLFSRYKITEDYGIISINLLEKDLENFRDNKNEENGNKDNKVLNDDINDINNINDLDRIGVPVDNKEKNNLKVMEKVQEENEENISNSENK